MKLPKVRIATLMLVIVIVELAMALIVETRGSATSEAELAARSRLIGD